MATLVSSSGLLRVLEHENTIGRAYHCALRIPARYVSGQHAVVRWTGRSWQVKDLGSRNGTFVDGSRLSPAETHTLSAGNRVAFGKVEEEWLFADATPPRPLVIPLEEGEPIIVDGDLVAIPSAAAPLATIYRTAEMRWFLEQSNAIIPISNQQSFAVEGHTYKFSCFENEQTAMATMNHLELSHLRLVFSVSRDEEHIHVRAHCGTRQIDFGERSHHYLLLILARKRLADVAAGFADTSCGWVCQEDFQHDSRLSPPQINIDVFRIRKQVEAAGIVGAANLIERRPRTRQLRLGTPYVSVATL